jgi:hypothetical protein
MWSCALTRPRASCPSSAPTFPAAPRAKSASRPSSASWPSSTRTCMALKAEREFILCGDVNIAHQKIDLKNWRSNQKNSGFLPEERAWMTKLLTQLWRRPGGRLPPAYSPTATDTCLHLVEQPRPGLCQQRGLAAGLPPGHARAGGTGAHRAIYKDEKFSDHAPITVEYDFALCCHHRCQKRTNHMPQCQPQETLALLMADPYDRCCSTNCAF